MAPIVLDGVRFGSLLGDLADRAGGAGGATGGALIGGETFEVDVGAPCSVLAQGAAVECVWLDLCFWPGWRNEISVHQHFERYLSAKAEHYPFSRDVLLWNHRSFLYIFHFSIPSVLFSDLRISAT